HDEIETYHDRIRETVLARLAPDARRGCHRRLAEALSTTSGADPEMLATHFQGAGDAGRAAGYWEEAASRALDALGFERAARLYRQAIASIGEEGEDGARKRALYERLGVALGHCGRGPEAAVAYLAAAEGAPAEPRLTMRRLAAEHYLMSGHLDEGLAVFRTVLGGTGLSIPWTSGGALARALALVALLRFKGLGFRARPLDQIPADVLSRLDAWSAAGSSMSHFDPSRAPYYHLRSLHLALESGDPYRLLRELVMDLCYRAAVRGGAPPTRFEVKIEALVGELLESLRGSGPRFQAAGGLVEAGRGIVLALRLECRAAREHLEHAEAELSACPLRLGNHITVARIWLVQVLYMLGELKELARRYAVFLADARARGDRFAEVQLSAFGYLLELMADRPEGARSAIDRMHGLWPRANPLARLGRLAPLVMTALYQGAGTGDAARLVLMTEWQRSSTWLAARLSKNLRVFLLLQHGAAHLAAAVDAAESRRPGLLQKVDRDARTLARQGTRFACAAALGLRAGAAAGRGDRIAAGALVAEAETCFAEVDMAHYANAARRRRGELLGGDEGRDLIASADAAMGAQGVSNPARMTAALLPGRW
ncbi:MAG: hypothetical protein ABI193_08815, partial [Minicystis sp.]